jgi:hypothetical protein
MPAAASMRTRESSVATLLQLLAMPFLLVFALIAEPALLLKPPNVAPDALRRIPFTQDTLLFLHRVHFYGLGRLRFRISVQHQLQGALPLAVMSIVQSMIPGFGMKLDLFKSTLLELPLDPDLRENHQHGTFRHKNSQCEHANNFVLRKNLMR